MFKSIAGLIFVISLCLSPLQAEPVYQTAIEVAAAQLPQLYPAPLQWLWLQQQHPTRQAYDALDFIADSAQHGLDPQDYHYDLLTSLDPSQSREVAWQFDLLLTTSLLQLMHDVKLGRTDPAMADPDWHIPRPTFNAIAYLQQARLSANFKSELNKLPPSSPTYHALQKLLVRYQSYADRGGWPILALPYLLRPGDTAPQIPLLRWRLAREDPQLLVTANNNSTVYDDELVAAVTRFQQNHNLKVDGIIGSETLSQLNISAKQRVAQIRVNLERYRWLPDKLGDRYLLINLASYQLLAINAGKPQLAMRVIIGRNQRQTPSFESAMTHIVFNPYWNVPPKLARLDLLPKQQADINYFYSNDIQVFSRHDSQWQEIDPYRIDWHTLDRRHFPYKLRQKPGPYNALGYMKFMFPNPWGIYLHDTPHKELFNQSKRNFSSGCIRVEHPLALANFSLAEPDADQIIHTIIDSHENIGRTLPKPLPVYAVYFTVWPTVNTINFNDDHYQRDHRLAKYL